MQQDGTEHGAGIELSPVATRNFAELHDACAYLSAPRDVLHARANTSSTHAWSRVGKRVRVCQCFPNMHFR